MKDVENTLVEFNAGQVIYDSHQMGTHIFVVLDGIVEIRQGHHRTRIVQKGQCFGELAMVETTWRRGVATSVTNTRCERLNREQFRQRTSEDTDFLRSVMRSFQQNFGTAPPPLACQGLNSGNDISHSYPQMFAGSVT